ncbi:MAG TPA: DUF6788 family protein [Acidimicrobiales bacterium]
MARSKASDQLAEHERRYRELAGKLAEIGLIASGSITQRSTRCGTPGCHCHADPPQLHGPYFQWTAKVNGKTVTRRLSEAEAQIYEEWIDNDRQMRAVITEMREIAAKAEAIILEAAVAS